MAQASYEDAIKVSDILEEHGARIAESVEQFARCLVSFPLDVRPNFLASCVVTVLLQTQTPEQNWNLMRDMLDQVIPELAKKPDR